MRAIAVGVVSLVLAAACPKGAPAQSLYGPGGLFLHPTASVPPKGQLTPAVLVLPQRFVEARKTRTWISGSLDYGLTEDLEVGAIALGVTNWEDSGREDPSYGGFAKYRFLREGRGRPAMAIGFSQLGFGDVNGRLAFLAMQKRVRGGERRYPVTAHLGVQYVDEVDGINRHEFQPYAGVEIGLAPRWALILEGRPRMNTENGTPLGVTVTYQVGRDWRLAATWANGGLSDHPMFGFGAGFALGGRR